MNMELGEDELEGMEVGESCNLHRATMHRCDTAAHVVTGWRLHLCRLQVGELAVANKLQRDMLEARHKGIHTFLSTHTFRSHLSIHTSPFTPSIHTFHSHLPFTPSIHTRRATRRYTS